MRLVSGAVASELNWENRRPTLAGSVGCRWRSGPCLLSSIFQNMTYFSCTDLLEFRVPHVCGICKNLRMDLCTDPRDAWCTIPHGASSNLTGEKSPAVVRSRVLPSRGAPDFPNSLSPRNEEEPSLPPSAICCALISSPPL